MDIASLNESLQSLITKIEKHWGAIPNEISAEIAGLKQIVNDLLLKDEPAPKQPEQPPTEPGAIQ